MKKLFFIFTLLFSIITNAQVLGYGDLGILLSSENNTQGTARSMAMKNAFGALGGDLSSFSINPAGTAIASNPLASITLGYGQQDISSDFYGNTIDNSNSNIDLAQLGAIIIFKNDANATGWHKFVMGINLNKINNFNKGWKAKGVAIPTWVNDPIDENISYTHVTSQEFENETSGSHTTLNYSLAAKYEDFLSVGIAINTYSLEYSEVSHLQEYANDNNDNTVDAYQRFWQETEGGGVSLAAGIIVKPTQNIRLGLSYISPVWYNLNEASNMFYEDDDDTEIGYYEVTYSNDPEPYHNNKNKMLSYEYNLRTPSKLTGSLAYVFGKKGLISADLTSKNYKNIKLSPSNEFSVENDAFNDNLVSTLKFNLGTEWRVKDISLRAGYSFEETPYLNAIDTDNISGYALGAGYHFGNYKIDVAYDYNENTDYFDFYPNFNINGAELSKSDARFVTTLSFMF